MDTRTLFYKQKDEKIKETKREERVINCYIEFCKKEELPICSDSLDKFLQSIINLVEEKANINY